MIKVFCINQNAISETKHFSEMTNEEFMNVADEYTLEEFTEAFNNCHINSNNDVIRFIECG